METSTITSTISEFIEREFLFRDPDVELELDTNLIKTGIVDSVGILRLVSFLENEFDLTFAPTEVRPENLSSLNAMTRFIGARLDDRSSA